MCNYYYYTKYPNGSIYVECSTLNQRAFEDYGVKTIPLSEIEVEVLCGLLGVSVPAPGYGYELARGRD